MDRLKSILKTILPFAIGVFFIYLTISTTSAEDQQRIYEYIKNADSRFIILSLLFGTLSNLARAYRWKYLLKPLGYQPRFINSVLAVMITYIANLGVPRSGEILRATTMRTYEKIPFEKGFGTIIAERLIDLVFLFSFILIALSLQFDMIWSFLKVKRVDTTTLISCFGVLICGFFFLRYLFKRSQNSWVLKLKKILTGLLEGILSLKTMTHKIPFALLSFFIWGMYLAMFYVIKWTVPETDSLTLVQILPAFVVGALTISATNGGIGIYPFSVGLMLSVFGISKEAGLAFGWVMWSGQTIMVIVIGSLAFFALPLFNRRMR